MSASTTPTDSPFAASAAARLTVTLDLPTPPLPLATAYTRVRVCGWANGITGSAVPGPRSLDCRSRRCSGLITPNSTWTPDTPGTAATATVMSVRSLSRIGQPATVSRMPSRTAPAGSTATDSTMSRSVIGRWISGSWTVASAAWMADSSDVAGADMRPMLRPCRRRVAGPGRSARVAEHVGVELVGRIRRRGRPLRRLPLLLALVLGPPVLRLVHLLHQLAQLRPDEVPGRHLAHRDPQRGDLPRQVLGVRLLHRRPPPVLVHGEAVPVGLPVLRQQDQRRGVAGLQGQHER